MLQPGRELVDIRCFHVHRGELQGQWNAIQLPAHVSDGRPVRDRQDAPRGRLRIYRRDPQPRLGWLNSSRMGQPCSEESDT
jgi:hypothetical protein